MTTQQLEDWLGQQKIYLAHFNRLIAEKAALEERSESDLCGDWASRYW